MDRSLALVLTLAVLGFCPSACWADSQISVVASPVPPGTNFNIFIFVDDAVVGPLFSITNGSEDVPFTTIYSVPGVQEIDEFQMTVPFEVLTNSVTLTWTNFSTNIPVVTQPYFSAVPQNQSVFVGSIAGFSALAAHTTGYQWQHGGTNLLDDGHFVGVTNSSLTISNVQTADAGDYTVVASHPLNPATMSATLSVYKPVLLEMEAQPSDGGYILAVANQDGSPFESNRIPNLQIYSTTALPADSLSWELETNAGTLGDGVLQFYFPDDGSTCKFWRALEQ
jgi:hypothetical protein